MGTEAVAIAKPSLFSSAVQKQVYCFGLGDRTSKPLLLGGDVITESAIALAHLQISFQIAIGNAFFAWLRYL
ncbi:MAG: hypothetical protein KME25_06135 [Symplocastrum torsivum CPER-KK1]|uniref:Uncharacterized protein n=1 Tax=Symplocastrum torsivum CPER-KK1 TaxID=450513 RepID=A0A951PJB6_9CYAN|nr:hypothetical protein [Symplocastrum torsivum CPER-KK1]